jgi:hypothetical protein
MAIQVSFQGQCNITQSVQCDRVFFNNLTQGNQIFTDWKGCLNLQQFDFFLSYSILICCYVKCFEIIVNNGTTIQFQETLTFGWAESLKIK